MRNVPFFHVVRLQKGYYPAASACGKRARMSSQALVAVGNNSVLILPIPNSSFIKRGEFNGSPLFPHK